MTDVAIADAVLLYNPGFNGETPVCVVRPIGHEDYYRYDSQTGACNARWRTLDTDGRKLQLMVDAWHATAFYEVPVEMVHRPMSVIPEYRDMLADDCLPKEYRHERED